MKKVDYNIEYAHIFTDVPRMGHRQRESVKIAKGIIKQLKKKKKNYVLTILVDEFTPTYSYLDVNNFLLTLEKEMVAPTYIVYESRLLPAVERLLGLLPKPKIIAREEKVNISGKKEIIKLKKSGKEIALEEIAKVKYKSRYYTPLLIAAWHLLRLGQINIPGAIRKTNLTKDIPFFAKKTITIIPKKFREIDEKSLILIKNTKFNKSIKNIEYIYY